MDKRIIERLKLKRVHIFKDGQVRNDAFSGEYILWEDFIKAKKEEMGEELI